MVSSPQSMHTGWLRVPQRAGPMYISEGTKGLSLYDVYPWLLAGIFQQEISVWWVQMREREQPDSYKACKLRKSLSSLFVDTHT